MGGQVVVRGRIPVDDDDDDDDGIPPEIKQLIDMTEAMHRRHVMMGGPLGGIMGGPRRLQNIRKAVPEERHDESYEDIMGRMNKLSEEIGERHDKDKMT